MKTLLCSALFLVFFGAVASDLSSPAPEGASVYFVTPADGETVPTTFTLKFGLRSMGVAPAGTDVANTGHHHLLIDLEEMPDLTLPLPSSGQIVHFGGGQTETTITLEPGKHRLRLLLGNHLHVPHTPPVMSPWIEISVTE